MIRKKNLKKKYVMINKFSKHSNIYFFHNFDANCRRKIKMKNQYGYWGHYKYITPNY